MTAKQRVFQTLDIMRHICSFGYPEYSYLMKRLCIDIIFRRALLTKVIKMYPYTEKHLQPTENRWYTLKDAIKNFFHLKQCRCCTRHSHNKPDIKIDIVDGLAWVVFYRKKKFVPECVNLHECPCDCRRRARMMSKLIESETVRKRNDLGCIGEKIDS